MPITWHLRRIVPRPEVWFLPEKASAMKQTYLRRIFNKASKCVCTSNVEYGLTSFLLIHQFLQL